MDGPCEGALRCRPPGGGTRCHPRRDLTPSRPLRTRPQPRSRRTGAVDAATPTVQLPGSLATPTASMTCPYPGLLAYGEDDASLFAGRDDDILACLERLEHHSVLVVSGASGSGKSSLVHAGLVPALRGLGHEIVVDRTEASRPGAVLVVDQFEERFPADAPHDATAFLDEAADWADVGRVVLAVRSDHVHAVALCTLRRPRHGWHPPRGPAIWRVAAASDRASGSAVWALARVGPGGRTRRRYCRRTWRTGAAVTRTAGDVGKPAITTS